MTGRNACAIATWSGAAIAIAVGIAVPEVKVQAFVMEMILIIGIALGWFCAQRDRDHER